MRPIGEIPEYQGVVDGATRPGTFDGGELPVCDGWVVDAKGFESDLRQQFCSTPEFLTCPIADYCTTQFMICEELTAEGDCVSPDGVANWEPALATPYCNCPGAWIKCNVD